MNAAKHITNRYRIIDKLGQGGMGVVWRVYDRLEKTEVALKQLRIPENQLDFASKPGTDDTDKMRLNLAQEFSILATLRHPHILSVLDFGFDDKAQPFYTMTLLNGGQDVKTYATNVSTRRRIILMGQMLQALHYLHRRSILHRDLKPDNVFVTRDEQIKVMDFGLANRATTQSSQDGDKITGTIAYMAPELLQGKRASVASDLFAVGVIVYEIMVGKHPFEGRSVGETILRIMTDTPDMAPIPLEFTPWLATLLDKDPAQRFATAYDAMIQFYDAVGVKPPAEDRTIRESFLQASEFVGRDAELKQLTDALDEIKTKNAFFLVGGESGVGKSRLLSELRVRALVSGADVMRGQGVDGGGLPFQLWRNIVRRLLLMVDVSDLQARVLKDLVPDVGDLLGREVTKAPDLTGKAYQNRIVLNIVDLFRNLRQPVVLLLEDLQWTGESLTVLQQMLKVPEQLSQLMIVANYRDDEAPDLPEKLTGMTLIKLGRLHADAVSELSRAMLGDRGGRRELVQMIQRNSEGNTFFVIETVRALAEEKGSLANVTTAELPQVVFTGSMQELMRRRLQQVDQKHAEIQTLAAVIGREIDRDLLTHAFDADKLQQWLTNATAYGVLEVKDNTWRFAHDKLREAVLADIPKDELPKTHRTAAAAIEAVYPENDGYNEALLNHWHEAGDFDKELHYLDAVAKKMIEVQGMHEEAQNLLQRALVVHMGADDGRKVSLLSWLAESCWSQSNYDASRDYAEQARQLATQLDERAALARSLSNLGLIAEDLGQYSDATDLYQQSLALCQQLDDQRGIASSLNNLGRLADIQGDFARATDLQQQSLVISQQLGDQRGIASSLNNLGVIAHSQDDYARAANLQQQSLALSYQLGDQHGIAKTLNNLGIIAVDQGDYARASDLYQQSLAIKQQLGDQLGISMTLSNLGMVAENQGAYARALYLYQQALTISQAIGDQLGVVYGYVYFGWVAFKQKDGQAARWFEQALRMAHSIQATSEALWIVVGFAGVLVEAEKAERAAHYVGLAQHHPAQENNTRKALSDVMPLLEAVLTTDELKAALERGKELDLDTVIKALLEEFTPTETQGKKLYSSQ